ncbi:hypothetical protein BGX28_007410 [Mortierella sp. GBA30]|nr:hypothetical protein BGX28_007410 [Mortierella sp. GBA30]
MTTAEMLLGNRGYYATSIFTRTASDNSSVVTDWKKKYFLMRPSSHSLNTGVRLSPMPLLARSSNGPSSFSRIFLCWSRESSQHRDNIKATTYNLGYDHGSNLTTFVLVAWRIVSSQLFGQEDIVISMGSVDERIRISMHCLFIRVDLSGEPNTFLQLEHVAFCLHNNSGDLVHERTHFISPQCDLIIHLAQDKEDATISIRYATALFNKDTIERHLGYLSTNRMNMVVYGSHPVASIVTLAVLKVGAAYVPIDSKAPVDRQAFIVRDSSAVLLVTDADIEIPSALALPLFRFDSATLHSTDMNGINGSNTAEVPGSSMKAEKSLAVNNGYADIGHDDRVTFTANPAFDASTFEVRVPLLNGGQMVIIDYDIFTHLLTHALEQHQVNTLWLTMAQFKQYVYTIGNLQMFAASLEHGGSERLINGYGPTETTRFATTDEATKSVPAFDATIFEVWAPLLHGARMVIVDYDTCMDPHRLANINRRALPEPDVSSFITQDYEPPQSELETALISFWMGFLRIDWIGRHDNFFTLCKHSLLAVRMIDTIRSRLGFRV